MYAVVVSLKIKPEMRERFLAAALDDCTCSRDEPGCLRFDVIQDNTDPNHYFFYEVYRDENAFKAHQGMAHYPRWRAAASTCPNISWARRLYFSRRALRSWSKSSRRKAFGICSIRKPTRSRIPSRNSEP